MLTIGRAQYLLRGGHLRRDCNSCIGSLPIEKRNFRAISQLIGFNHAQDIDSDGRNVLDSDVPEKEKEAWRHAKKYKHNPLLANCDKEV